MASHLAAIRLLFGKTERKFCKADQVKLFLCVLPKKQDAFLLRAGLDKTMISRYSEVEFGCAEALQKGEDILWLQRNPKK